MSSLRTGLKALQHWGRLHYDKILAIAALIALAFSLLYLAVKIGTLQQMQETFERRIRGYTPAHPEAAGVDAAPYEKTLALLDRPVQLAEWTNALLTPEKRVSCVDCQRPIPYEAAVCGFCKAQQPKNREDEDDFDGDRDGIPNKAETGLGLNPDNPDDAAEDSDGDGFSNLVEYKARTDIHNKNDFPPPEQLLVVKGISGEPFGLEFRGKVKLDGGYKFQVNVRENQRTYMLRLGDSAEGFKVVEYKEHVVREEVRGLMRTIDKSVLVFQRGNKLIPVQLNIKKPYTEWKAVLEFKLDDSKHEVQLDQLFKIKGRDFKVAEIDSVGKTVVIIRVSDGKRVEIKEGSRRDAPGAAAVVGDAR